MDPFSPSRRYILLVIYSGKHKATRAGKGILKIHAFSAFFPIAIAGGFGSGRAAALDWFLRWNRGGKGLFFWLLILLAHATILTRQSEKAMTQKLKPFRDRIDAIDDQIIDLLAARIAIVREVAAIKKADDIPAVLPERVEEVKNRAAARAESKNLDGGLVRKLYTLLIDYCCDLEESLKAKK